MKARLERAIGAEFPSGASAEPLREILALRFPGHRILVAEDDAIGQAVARGKLQDAGLVVDTVSNGREAVERAGAQAYSLILMDMKMPVMDGSSAPPRRPVATACRPTWLHGPTPQPCARRGHRARRASIHPADRVRVKT